MVIESESSYRMRGQGHVKVVRHERRKEKPM